MRRVILGFFATLGVLVFAVVLAGIAGWFLLKPGAKPLAARDVLVLDLTQPLPEGPPEGGIERVLLGERTSFRDVLDGIARAGADPRVKGIVARVGDGSLGTAEVQELRDAIARFRATGKFAFAYADSFGELGSGMRGYYLATAFDQIWLQPVGSVGLVGLRVEMPFFRGLLDKIGVTPVFQHREEFKTAANTITKTAMTPAQREETESLLHSVYDQIVGGIAAGRKLDPARVQELIDQGPFTPQQALDAHLIDHQGYRDDVVAAARVRAGDNAALVSLTRYLGDAGRPHRSGPTIAVIYGTGLITGGSSSQNPLSGSELLGADSLARAFRQASQDAAVRAILFRIDSPGGSATASETIWREVERARQAGKPIIVSMGDVAGSGGYYIAAGANKIVAEPATLTGSIGVLGGKVLIDGLSQKLGITWDGAQIGRNASIDSVIQDFTPDEQQHFAQSLDYVYGVFKDRVAQGRKLSADAVEQVAKGRVWTGAEARKNGLVDALGGFHAALELAKQAAGIPPNSDITLKTFPKPSESPAAIIARLLGRSAPDEAASTRLAALDRVLALLAPAFQRIDTGRVSGTLLMPPIELR